MNLTSLTRGALVTATSLLVLACAGCGGGASGAPDDASRADFCKAFLAEPEGFDSDDTDEAVEAAHEYADKLSDVGTPDVSDDAREGFELYVDFLADIEADDVAELEDAEFSDVFDDDDLKKFEAFTEVTADCGPGEF